MSVKRLGVVGSGVMGAGVTELASCSGLEVVLRARERSAAQASFSAVRTKLERRVAKGLLSEEESEEALSRITLTEELSELSECDLVLESVVEDLPAKLNLFADLDRTCAEHTLLATNTSTLPVSELALATSRPEKVCGIHFFNPAPVMPVVEVVRPATASEETIAAALEFARACGKRAVLVADRAGFVVNALLFPYLNNAVRLLESGAASMEDIDEAMKGGCGHPMGPFALLDLVGIDVSIAILESLESAYGEANYAPAGRLREMVAGGLLGRKSGAGFYRYGAP